MTVDVPMLLSVDGLRVGDTVGAIEGVLVGRWSVGTGVGLAEGLREGPTGAEDGVRLGHISYNVSNNSTSC
jgi:hypothetical protein